MCNKLAAVLSCWSYSAAERWPEGGSIGSFRMSLLFCCVLLALVPMSVATEVRVSGAELLPWRKPPPHPGTWDDPGYGYNQLLLRLLQLASLHQDTKNLDDGDWNGPEARKRSSIRGLFSPLLAQNKNNRSVQNTSGNTDTVDSRDTELLQELG